MVVKSNGNDEYHESKIINELCLEDSEVGIIGKCVTNDDDIIMKINGKNVNEENKNKIGYQADNEIKDAFFIGKVEVLVRRTGLMVNNVENVGFCIIGDVRVSLSKTDNRIDGVKNINDFGMQRVLVVVEV